MVVPGSAAVAVGQVWHRRNRPTTHEFTYPTVQVWIDPDKPEQLFGRHPLWSTDRPRPIRFRRRDYFDGGTEPIGPALRSMLTERLGHRPTGPIRMLTQPRTWGWLFNPITVYLVWDAGDVGDAGHHGAVGQPVGAVLEVTNTPWKERVLYQTMLRPDGDRLTARFAKQLHVSPFLGQDFTYRLSVGPTAEPGAIETGRNLEVAVDVHQGDADLGDVGDDAEDDPAALLETRLGVQLLSPSRRSMTATLFRHPLPTHRVSLGIHVQAAKLWRKRVPFVSHPNRSAEMSRP